MWYSEDTTVQTIFQKKGRECWARERGEAGRTRISPDARSRRGYDFSAAFLSRSLSIRSILTFLISVYLSREHSSRGYVAIYYRYGHLSRSGSIETEAWIA